MTKLDEDKWPCAFVVDLKIVRVATVKSRKSDNFTFISKAKPVLILLKIKTGFALEMGFYFGKSATK